MKITTVVGARPQFIKASMVSRAFLEAPGVIEQVIHTGQHYDAQMSDIFFEELEIRPPQYHLGVGSGTHGHQTGQMLQAIEEVLLRENPDFVLVYGDTNSTLAGALAAAKLHIPIAHVEAGLRSYNRRMPEEINRVLTDHCSEMLFAPTSSAVNNLLKESIAASKIFLVGDVMYDAAIHFGQKAKETSKIMSNMNIHPRSYILATIHRAENTENPARLKAIFDGLSRVAIDIPVVIPLHPRTRNILLQTELKVFLDSPTQRLSIVSPVGYLDMIMLEQNARLIVTDSGGVQKEAFFYQVPCVTLRDETEWVELTELKWNTLVKPESPQVIYQTILDSLNLSGLGGNPYGTGNTAKEIVDLITKR